VKIAQQVIDEVLAHAREEAPNECCGLLIGNRIMIEASVRTRNREASPTRFLIDPEDHFTAIHTARASGKRVVGAYHSHPSSAAQPSESDIAEANWGSDFLYMIVSLKAPAPEVFAYRLKRGTVVPVAFLRA
jgi:[CysO sulfur-carrier protein]-S-L-cysteine hydrolase